MKETVVALLCMSLVACTANEDTARGGMWARSVEPRLSRSVWRACERRTLLPGRVIEITQCGTTPHISPTPVSEGSEGCGEAMIESHEQAVEVIASQPRCINDAIAALERFAPAQPVAWSDLAAAYYVRAQRDDEPQDLLRAAEAGRRATEATPQSAAAHFNRALSEEALGLTDRAIASWTQVTQLERSNWADEAAMRRDRLVERRSADAAAEWQRNARQLPTAVKSGDRRAVSRLVSAAPAAAQRYVIRDLLGSWAMTGDASQLQNAGAVAAALTEVTGDRHLEEVVRAAAAAGDRSIAREAHRVFNDALKGGQRAAADYRRAKELFHRFGSPLRLTAELSEVTLLSFEPGRLDEATARLVAIEREARLHGYKLLAARVRSMRGFFLMSDGRYIESLREYSAAAEAFTHAKDRESVATFHARQVGVYRLIGQTELAWREAFQAQRFTPSVIDPKERHYLLGEIAETVAVLGYPAIALHYQNTAVRLLERALAAAGSADRNLLEVHLGVALRGRAAIELRIGREEHARRDLERSLTFAGDQRRTGDLHRAVMARNLETRGRTLVASEPRAAVDAFTRALALPEPEGFRTFRASLLAQRADAYRRAGDPAAAQADLQAAIEQLRVEEAQTLARRERGANEEVWSAYFSRFRDTYERLVLQLAADRKTDEAFVYAERVRAIEPLDLVLRRPKIVPPEFLPLVDKGRTPSLAEIQAKLPPATFLVQYFVLEDRTFAWVLSKTHASFLPLSARRADIERWSGELQTAARDRKPLRFDLGLYPAFDKLVREALSVIAQWPGADSADRRLVFIPDQSLHGLPFAALRNPVTRRYLIEDYAVEIAGSATLYVFSLLRDQELAANRVSAFVVGDPAFDRRLPIARTLGRIPRAQSEVQRIARLYGPDAQLSVGAQATVPEFLQRARNSSVVHIAAHAVANARAPFNSLLLFAPSEAHSGALTAEELLEQAELEKTRLFVMSACSSAGGSPVGPEGLAPLVRPLIGTGIPAVIGSLWDVDDAAAEALLVSFHRHYLGGKNAAAALRAAQLEVIHQTSNPGLRPVLAWAPFQVIGHAASPASTAR